MCYITEELSKTSSCKHPKENPHSSNFCSPVTYEPKSSTWASVIVNELLSFQLIAGSPMLDWFVLIAYQDFRLVPVLSFQNPRLRAVHFLFVSSPGRHGHIHRSLPLPGHLPGRFSFVTNSMLLAVGFRAVIVAEYFTYEDL